MSTKAYFGGDFHLETDKTTNVEVALMARNTLPDQVRYSSEEIRHEQAYRDYKQDLLGSYEQDTRLETDFFGHRELSISDFDGTRTIVTAPTSPATNTPPQPDYHCATPRTLRVAAYPEQDASRHDNISSVRSAVSNTTHLSTKDFLNDDLAYPSLEYAGNLTSPLYGANGFCFDHPPTTAEIVQKTFEASRPLPSPTSPSPIPWSQLSPSTSYQPASPLQDWDCDRFETEKENPVAPLDSDTDWDHERAALNTRMYIHPSSFTRLVEADIDSECSSVRDVGCVNSHIYIENSTTERVLALPESAEVHDISIQEHIQDNDIDDIEGANEVELSYDASPGTLHFYSQAGVHITTRELQDDFVVAQSTNLAGGHLDVDPVAEAEKARMNVDFFENSFPAKARSSPRVLLVAESPGSADGSMRYAKQIHVDFEQCDLIPSMIDDLADPDYYLGPGAPAPDDSIFDKEYNAPIASARRRQDPPSQQGLQMARLGNAPFADSLLLKRHANRDSATTTRDSQQLLPSTTFGQSTVASFGYLSPPCSVDHDLISPVRVSETLNHGESFLVRKRRARESIDLIDLCNENTQHEYVQKRCRIASISPIASILEPSTPISTISSISVGSPMATALAGYAGQFELHSTENLSCVEESTTQHVFGNHLHANGEVINLHFTADSASSAPELSDAPGLRATIEHANLHHTFAEEMPRTSEEEDLRKEAHRECAAARLEGVPVGYYRYFAGHMTVEEYVEARMCVCWERCICSKLCTRFGDLVCPCAGNLVVGEEA